MKKIARNPPHPKWLTGKNSPSPGTENINTSSNHICPRVRPSDFEMERELI